jgi:hypothetical protein
MPLQGRTDAKGISLLSPKKAPIKPPGREKKPPKKEPPPPPNPGEPNQKDRPPVGDPPDRRVPKKLALQSKVRLLQHPLAAFVQCVVNYA